MSIKKIQIGICYICNNPIYNITKKYRRITNIEMKHITKKCRLKGMERYLNDKPIRHRKYRIPKKEVHNESPRIDTKIQKNKKR